MAGLPHVFYFTNRQTTVMIMCASIKSCPLNSKNVIMDLVASLFVCQLVTYSYGIVSSTLHLYRTFDKDTKVIQCTPSPKSLSLATLEHRLSLGGTLNRLSQEVTLKINSFCICFVTKIWFNVSRHHSGIQQVVSRMQLVVSNRQLVECSMEQVVSRMQ